MPNVAAFKTLQDANLEIPDPKTRVEDRHFRFDLPNYAPLSSVLLFRLRALEDSTFQFRIAGTDPLSHQLRSEATRSFHEIYPGDSLKEAGNELTLSVGSGRVVVSDILILYQTKEPFDGSIVNVKDFGARGKGDEKDAAAVKAAVDAAQEGQAVYFPAGTYVVTEPLETKANQLYFSLGQATLNALGPEGFSMFLVGQGPVEFRGLVIDGAWTETSAPSDHAGISRPAAAQGAIEVAVSNCRIQNSHGHGISIAGGSSSSPELDRVLVRDTVIDHCGMNGLAFGQIENVRVESSRFERCNNGIKMRACRNVVVRGVTANANRRHGIVFTFSHDWHVDSCIARGNGPQTAGSDDPGGWGIAAGGEPGSGLDPNSDFTITNNICEGNGEGGITLDPTMSDAPETIWSQRARVSGNVCRAAEGALGIHITHSSDVVVTDNVCSDDCGPRPKGSGIQLVSSSHILAQGNICFCKHNGIGLFSNELVTDPGYHLIGVNMLDRNEVDVFHQPGGQGQPLTAVRIHGLHGENTPNDNVQAEPGTLYEWHKDGQGALYVKQTGNQTTGWTRVQTQDP
jgi:Right handed beta helix region/Pectate lyase superfamily protein